MTDGPKFLVVKTKDTKSISYFDYEKINGYSLTAKSNVKFEDAINIDRMIIINPSFAEKLADRKIKMKFEKFVALVSIVCDTDDDSGDLYQLVLDEANKFRMELINKYKQYVAEEKMELYLKKIAILTDEVNLRLRALEDRYNEEYLMGKEGKSR